MNKCRYSCKACKRWIGECDCSHCTSRELLEGIPSEFGMKVTDIILNKDEGWSGKLEECLLEFLETARNEERENWLQKIDGMMFVDPSQAGQFSMHTDGYNQAIEEVKELLIK